MHDLAPPQRFRPSHSKHELWRLDIGGCAELLTQSDRAINQTTRSRGLQVPCEIQTTYCCMIFLLAGISTIVCYEA